MSSTGNGGGVSPARADRSNGLFGLTRKQKRLLWYTFFGAILVAGGIWTYLYISSAPQRAQQQFDAAMKMMKPGNYEAAIEGLTRAIQISPLAEAYFERGNAYHVLGRDQEAIADFETAADVDPNLYRAYAAMGGIYRDRKDYRRAMEAYTKSISAKPSLDALYERGQTYELLGEHRKAIEDYDRAILEMPDSPSVYRARGLARRNLGDQAGYEADRDAANLMDHRQ